MATNKRKCKNCFQVFEKQRSLQYCCSMICAIEHQNKMKNYKVQIKPINKISNKRKKENNLYSSLRKQFLKDNPLCAVTGNKATEVHHMAGRIGKLLTDVRYFLPVCRFAHREIELNPIWAKENGYSLNRTNV